MHENIVDLEAKTSLCVGATPSFPGRCLDRYPNPRSVVVVIIAVAVAAIAVVVLATVLFACLFPIPALLCSIGAQEVLEVSKFLCRTMVSRASGDASVLTGVEIDSNGCLTSVLVRHWW